MSNPGPRGDRPAVASMGRPGWDGLPFADFDRYDFGVNLSEFQMRKFAVSKIKFSCLLAVLAAVISLSSPAQAQTPKYASPTGTSANPCTAASPCDLLSAILATSSGGEVSCFHGGFYAFNLPFIASVTIDCPGAVITGSSGPALRLIGTSSQVVILRNLTFDGNGQTGGPLISVTAGATLIIENCKFLNVVHGNGIAIQYLPSNSGSQLIIRDSVFANNGIAPATGGGLQVLPAAGGSASVLLERVSFNYNVTSVALLGTVSATMINSTVSASRSNGIIVSGATLDINDSTLVYNSGSAVSVFGGGTVRLSNNDIKTNQVGISNSGGQALSYLNNRITANGSSATLTPIQGGQ